MCTCIRVTLSESKQAMTRPFSTWQVREGWANLHSVSEREQVPRWNSLHTSSVSHLVSRPMVTLTAMAVPRWAEGWGGAARCDEAQKLQKMSTVARRSSDYQSRNENQTLLWTGRGHSLLISQWGSMTRIWDQFKVRQGERWIERAEVE